MSPISATIEEIPLPKPEGLEGVVAASTALSHVFGEEGRLVYRGYDIHELAGHATFEEVAHLLWIGHLPNKLELAELNARLEANRLLPDSIIDILRAIPAEASPMDALRTAVSALGPQFPDLFSIEHPATLDSAIALSARFPTRPDIARPKATCTSCSVLNRMKSTGARSRRTSSCSLTTA